MYRCVGCSQVTSTTRPEKGEWTTTFAAGGGAPIGTARGKLVQRKGGPTFFADCEEHSQELQGIAVSWCDIHGRPTRLAALRSALGPEAARGGFLYIHHFAIANAGSNAAAADYTAQGAAALRALLLTDPQLAGKWTLAAYIPAAEAEAQLTRQQDAHQFLRAGFRQVGLLRRRAQLSCKGLISVPRSVCVCVLLSLSLSFSSNSSISSIISFL